MFKNLKLRYLNILVKQYDCQIISIDMELSYPNKEDINNKKDKALLKHREELVHKREALISIIKDVKNGL